MSNTSEISSVATSSSTTATPTPTPTPTIQTTTSTTHATTTSTETSVTTTGLNDGQKAGIAVGVIVFVIIIVAIIVFIVIRRRRHDRSPLSDGESQDEGKNVHAENRQKRKENKYVKKNPPEADIPVKKDPPKADIPEVLYENPGADQENYYNVEGQNSDSAVNADQTTGSRKPPVLKQDSVPTIYAPPPPSVEDNRTSMPLEIAPSCPVIDEDDDYIIPEEPSKITVAKRPPYTGRTPQNNDGELYLDMRSTPGEELYIDPDSGQDQKSYMNFDAKSKPMEDEERKGGPKDYINMSKHEKGFPFGVHPKNINATPSWEATTPVTINDEESYQNVLYENKSKQNKKPPRKK